MVLRTIFAAALLVLVTATPALATHEQPTVDNQYGRPVLDVPGGDDAGANEGGAGRGGSSPSAAPGTSAANPAASAAASTQPDGDGRNRATPPATRLDYDSDVVGASSAVRGGAKADGANRPLIAALGMVGVFALVGATVTIRRRRNRA